MASYWGLFRAVTGRGSRSSSSVWGGCFSGRIKDLKEMVRKASAPSQESEMALQQDRHENSGSYHAAKPMRTAFTYLSQPTDLDELT